MRASITNCIWTTLATLYLTRHAQINVYEFILKSRFKLKLIQNLFSKIRIKFYQGQSFINLSFMRRNNSPSLLPSGNTACQGCIYWKLEKDSENEVKCSICKSNHLIPENGFLINLVVSELTKLKAEHISRPENVTRLKSN